MTGRAALAAMCFGLTASCTINININLPPTSVRPTETGSPGEVAVPTNPVRGTQRVTAPPASTVEPAQTRPPPALQSPAAPAVADCPIFPPDHIWNTRVDTLPLAPDSQSYIDAIGRDEGLHPDFGAGLWEGGPIGIPYNVVDSAVRKVGLSFEYADESDRGRYPIPLDPLIEGGPSSDGDRHILIVERDSCVLYELYAAYQNPDGGWRAGSGAIWELRGYDLRPDGWTSADAAGLPILPGLVRYEEVAAGEIRHAIRFTAENVRGEFIWPARHEASDSDDPNFPPFGQRFRLKSSFDISPYPREVQVILQAMKIYGLILADNGSNWYITGVPDERWNNDELVPLLREVTGDNFEAVDVSGLMIDPASGQARQP